MMARLRGFLSLFASIVLGASVFGSLSSAFGSAFNGMFFHPRNG
jgi:hypothetical protein